MVDSVRPERKKIRLQSEVYGDVTAVSLVTICTLDRTAIFRADLFARRCVELLKAQARTSEVRLYAYCFMPDHLHMLFSPSHQKSIIDFVREFKGQSTRLAWGFGYRGSVWQARFHDHFLRREEEIERVVLYILNNPVRKDMVSDWHDYPYCGSLEYEL